MRPVKWYKDRANFSVWADAKRFLFDQSEELQSLIDSAGLSIDRNPLRIEFVQLLTKRMFDNKLKDKYIDTALCGRTPEQRLVFAIIYQAMNDYVDYHPEKGRKNGHTRQEVV